MSECAFKKKNKFKVFKVITFSMQTNLSAREAYGVEVWRECETFHHLVNLSPKWKVGNENVDWPKCVQRTF